MKTNDLTDAALDWAVAKCEGAVYHGPAWTKPSTDWAQGGPIIEREKLDVECLSNDWHARHPKNAGGLIRYHGYGPTPLIAAMRCYVASQLGDDIDVPKELT